MQNPQSGSTSSLALASSFAGRTGSALLLTKPSGDITRITKLVVEPMANILYAEPLDPMLLPKGGEFDISNVPVR